MHVSFWYLFRSIPCFEIRWYFWQWIFVVLYLFLFSHFLNIFSTLVMVSFAMQKLFRLTLLILLPMLLDSHRKIKLSRLNFRGYRLMFAFTTYDSSSYHLCIYFTWLGFCFIFQHFSFDSQFLIIIIVENFLFTNECFLHISLKSVAYAQIYFSISVPFQYILTPLPFYLN